MCFILSWFLIWFHFELDRSNFSVNQKLLGCCKCCVKSKIMSVLLLLTEVKVTRASTRPCVMHNRCSMHISRQVGMGNFVSMTQNIFLFPLRVRQFSVISYEFHCFVLLWDPSSKRMKVSFEKSNFIFWTYILTFRFDIVDLKP